MDLTMIRVMLELTLVPVIITRQIRRFEKIMNRSRENHDQSISGQFVTALSQHINPDKIPSCD